MYDLHKLIFYSAEIIENEESQGPVAPENDVVSNSEAGENETITGAETRESPSHSKTETNLICKDR